MLTDSRLLLFCYQNRPVDIFSAMSDRFKILVPNFSLTFYPMPNYHQFLASYPLLQDNLRFFMKILAGPHTIVSVVGQDISLFYLRVPQPQNSPVLCFFILVSVSSNSFLMRFRIASRLTKSFNFIVTYRPTAKIGLGKIVMSADPRLRQKSACACS